MSVFNDTATPDIYRYLHTLSPPDALPICRGDDEAERAGQPHRDHVGVERFAHADSGVEPARAEVGKGVVGENLDLDLGIGFAEAGEYRFEQRLHRAAHQVDPQPPGGPVAEDRKSTRLTSSHYCAYRMPSSA